MFANLLAATTSSLNLPKTQKPSVNTGIEIRLIGGYLSKSISLGLYISPFVCFGLGNEKVNSSVCPYTVDATQVKWNETLLLPCTQSFIDNSSKVQLTIEALHTRSLVYSKVTLGHASLILDDEFMRSNQDQIITVELRKENETCGQLTMKLKTKGLVLPKRHVVVPTPVTVGRNVVVEESDGEEDDDEFYDLDDENDADDHSEVEHSLPASQVSTSSSLLNSQRSPILDETICSDSLIFDSLEELEEKGSVKEVKSKYVLGKQIGKGGMGTVYLAKDSANNLVAIKKVFCGDAEAVNRAMQEVWPIRTLNHQNLVLYTDIFFEDNQDQKGTFAVCMVMEYYSDGDLHSLLQKRLSSKNYYDQTTVLNMMLQLSEGLAHLHEKNLLHRDLKPMNIFAKGDSVKIGDFGLVKDVEKESAHTTAGTQKYMAPEIFLKEPYSLKADIWSLGVTFYDMLALHVDKLPYLEVYRNKNFYQDIETELLEHGYCRDIVTIVQQCLSLDPKHRPTAPQLSKYLKRVLGLEVEQSPNEVDHDESTMHFRTTSSIFDQTVHTLESVEKRVGTEIDQVFNHGLKRMSSVLSAVGLDISEPQSARRRTLSSFFE